MGSRQQQQQSFLPLQRPCDPCLSLSLSRSLPVRLSPCLCFPSHTHFSPPPIHLETFMSKPLSWVALAAALLVGPQQVCFAWSTTAASIRQADTSLSFATPFLPRLFQRARAMIRPVGDAPPRAPMMTVANGKTDGKGVASVDDMILTFDHASCFKGYQYFVDTLYDSARAGSIWTSVHSSPAVVQQ